MIYLIDTNVLLRFLHQTDPHHSMAFNAVDALKANGDQLRTTFQNFIVATMLTHNVTHLLTFDTSDFARYAPEGIVAVDPASM